MAGKRLSAWFVCGGKYHDIDYARVELLTLLGEHERIRTRMTEDYRDVSILDKTDLLITYTVDVLPDEAGASRIRDWVASGKRWLALHGTNSTLKYIKGKGWDAPRSAPLFMETLGSQFVAHPPIQPYRVELTKPEHPLVFGFEPFDADVELYLSELHPPFETLLHTRYSGEAKGFIESDWATDEPRPVMYIKPVGFGEVLYLTLGHARGKYDMQPLMEEYPQVERGSWKEPAFYELLRRGIRWAARLE